MSGNNLLTIDMITREAVMLFLNSNAFIANINRQYDDQFAKTGAKIGTSLRIRLPNDYVVSDGPALQVQNTDEQSTTLVVATQKHVDVSFSSVDRTMKLDDYSEIVLAPMVNNLAGGVAQNIMDGVEGGVANLVANTDNTGAIISPTADTWLLAGASLDNNSAQVADRKLVASPNTMARTVSSLSGLFNPAQDISRQYRNARMYDALNFEWFQDQTTIVHTSGTFTAGTLASADQTGTSITTNAITGTLKKGDIITIEGVNAVNRVTKADTGDLRQFVVLADVPSGGTSISIYPALVPPNNGAQVQYQTVTASPASGANVYLATPAGGRYRKNIAYAKQAVTMVTADLEIPAGGIIEGARAKKDSLSMRMISQYIIGTDQSATRLDILFGKLYVRPEWAVCVADKV
jgi:hypothetical protein